METTCRECGQKVTPKGEWHGGREIFFCPLCLTPISMPRSPGSSSFLAVSIRRAVRKKDKIPGKVRRLSEEEIRSQYGKKRT